MPWLWFAGPLTFLFVVVIFNAWPTSEERRIRRELERWLEEMLGPLWGPDDTEESRHADELPPALELALDACGKGARLADIVLVPDLAYMCVRTSDVLTSANHHTVACRLRKRAPKMVCHPLAIVDGRPVENDGIQFDDEEFMEHFAVDATDQRGVRKWLHEDIREALMQFPDLWLRTDGATMTLSYYGPPDAELLDELVEAADIIFSEYGAGGGEPLFGDERTWDFVDETEDELEEVDAELGDETVEVLGSKRDRITAGVIDFALYGLGGVLLVMVLGYFPGFHPSWLFNSPDSVVTEPWQGGWTTKGFGALVFVESYLLGVLALQAHLAVKYGQSVGKLLVGLEIVRIDGEAHSFTKTVLLRKWIFLLVPIAAAAVQSRPFSARALFNHIPTKATAGAALAVGVVLLISWLVNAQHRGVHDLAAGTEVVECKPYRLPALQFGISKNDPIVGRRLVYGACALVAFVGANLVSLMWLDAWFFEVHAWM